MLPQTPRGFRDVLPDEAAWRASINDDVQDCFASWGYMPIETPALEVLETMEAAGGVTAKPISLFDSDGWWLPIRDSFMFRGYLPPGDERGFATVGMLRDELVQINAWEWKADEETILGWCETEGYPTDALYGKGKIQRIAENRKYPTVSLAKFAFSILWQAVLHSEKYGTLIIFDY